MAHGARLHPDQLSRRRQFQDAHRRQPNARQCRPDALTRAGHLARQSDGRGDDGLTGSGTVQRAAELTSAYCRAAPVAVAWLRERPGGQIRVITAGPGMAAFTDNGQDVLAFPAGARGQELGDGQAARLLAALPCWVQLAGVCDVLLTDPDVPGLTPGGRPAGPLGRAVICWRGLKTSLTGRSSRCPG